MNIFLTTYRKVFALLTPEFKRRFWLLQGVIILTSIVDLAGLAAFIPVLSAVAEPELLNGDGLLARLKTASGIEENNYFLLTLFAGAFGFFILRAAFIFWSNWVQNRFVFDLKEYIGYNTFNYYLQSSYEEFQKRNSAQIIRDLTVNPQHFAKFLVLPLLMLTTEVLVILMIIGGIALYNFEVFLLLMSTIFPVAFLFNKLVKKRVKAYGKQANNLTTKLYSHSSRGIMGFVDVKLRSKQYSLLSDYNVVDKKLNRISQVTSVLGIMPAKLFELATVGGLLLLFTYSAFWAQNPALILPLIAIYAAAGYRIIPSLSKIVPAFMHLERYGYLFDVFKKPLSSQRKQQISINTNAFYFNNYIKLKNITFNFIGESKALFKNLNFEINQGEVVGLVGKSGSGKTTLVKLIAGFLRPSSGEIWIDNQQLTPQNTAAWMQNISYVQQSPYLEAGSLTKNIAFLEEEVDQKRLKEAIEKASLTDFVQGRNPHEITIEENGKNLSGGQKQRVVIARALYHRSKLIILDEATSALDNETEAAITATVNNLKGSGVTIIIIAHRLSTLKGADRVVEMELMNVKHKKILEN